MCMSITVYNVFSVVSQIDLKTARNMKACIQSKVEIKVSVNPPHEL